jgi:hypothetical protein
VDKPSAAELIITLIPPRIPFIQHNTYSKKGADPNGIPFMSDYYAVFFIYYWGAARIDGHCEGQARYQAEQIQEDEENPTIAIRNFGFNIEDSKESDIFSVPSGVGFVLRCIPIFGRRIFPLPEH